MIETLIPIRFIKAFSLVSAATVLGLACLHAEPIGSVLTSPDSYHHKRVSLVGILRGEGPIFELYANPADALAMNAARSIWVFAPEGWQESAPYDLRSARVVGTVDAKRHGVWGHPCSLSLETLKILSGPVAPWPYPVAVFHNESGIAILLLFGMPATEFRVEPGDYTNVAIQDCVLRAVSAKGVPMAEARIAKRTEAPYYDGVNAASYYRIKDKKIEAVLPSVAKSWGWRR
jgi:hypothetical protein